MDSLMGGRAAVSCEQKQDFKIKNHSTNLHSWGKHSTKFPQATQAAEEEAMSLWTVI